MGMEDLKQKTANMRVNSIWERSKDKEKSTSVMEMCMLGALLMENQKEKANITGKISSFTAGNSKMVLWKEQESGSQKMAIPMMGTITEA